MILAGLQFGNARLKNVEADYAVLLSILNRQRQTDITEAYHCDNSI